MHIYEITVDGRSYQGESDMTYSANYGGRGWHITNHGEASHLVFDDKSPKLLYGLRGLNSAIERITRYAKHGLIEANCIIINRYDDTAEDFAICGDCEKRMQLVRPGKFQCVECE